jgi:hypothetical protein
MERWRTSPNAVFTSLPEGGGVVVDLKNREVLRINGTAAALWAALEVGATEEALANMLAERYEVAATVASTDARGFLQRLQGDELVERIRS